MRRAWIAYGVLMIAVALIPAGSRAQWSTAWSYDGPAGAAHWGDLDPAYAACASGREQSPIDIRSAARVDLPALRFDYRSGPLQIINNGYTAVRVDYVHSNDVLIVGGRRYELTQFHFHHPSEEYVHGKPSDMVLHLMHASSDGHVAAVAVLLEAGRVNTAIQQLWAHMPVTAGPAQAIAGVEINPLDLLPPTTGYYTYSGSLTAPPCTEHVEWFVLKTPVELSAEQIHAFATLYPHDVRPVQPLNGRVVKESQ